MLQELNSDGDSNCAGAGRERGAPMMSIGVKSLVLKLPSELLVELVSSPLTELLGSAGDG